MFVILQLERKDEGTIWKINRWWVVVVVEGRNVGSNLEEVNSVVGG